MAQPTANIFRRLRDASNTKSVALPAAAASANTGSVDLGSVVLGPLADDIEVEINLPATPSLVDAKTVTLTLKDSADNSTFAAIAGGPAAVVVTGASGAGGVATVARVKLPPSTRRYIRLQADVLTAGGDSTAVSVTMAVLANPS